MLGDWVTDHYYSLSTALESGDDNDNTVGDGEADKGDLRDKESERCSCVLFQPLASKSIVF